MILPCEVFRPNYKHARQDPYYCYSCLHNPCAGDDLEWCPVWKLTGLELWLFLNIEIIDPLADPRLILDNIRVACHHMRED